MIEIEIPLHALETKTYWVVFYYDRFCPRRTRYLQPEKCLEAYLEEDRRANNCTTGLLSATWYLTWIPSASDVASPRDRLLAWLELDSRPARANAMVRHTTSYLKAVQYFTGNRCSRLMLGRLLSIIDHLSIFNRKSAYDLWTSLSCNWSLFWTH